MKTIRRKILISINIIAIITMLFLHFYVPRFIVEIKNPFIELARTNFIQTDLHTINSTEIGKKITFFSRDGLAMKALLNHSKTNSEKGTVIFIHGIRSSKEQYAKLSKKMTRIGYNTVAVDLRAHGESQGEYCTFGYKEKYDISKLIDYLIEKEGMDKNIGIWAHSLGGAIGIQSMAIDQRIKFGIIESSYSDFGQITKDYSNYYLNFEFDLLNEHLNERAADLAGFRLEQINPKDYCKKITQPILLVHGNQDKKINIKYARENFRNLKSKHKTFIEVSGANHTDIWQIGGKNYFEKVILFINRNCSAEF